MQLKKWTETLRFYLEPLHEVIKTSLPAPVRSWLNRANRKSVQGKSGYQIESRSRLIFWWRLRRAKTYTGTEVLNRFSYRRKWERQIRGNIRFGVYTTLVVVTVFFILITPFRKLVTSTLESAMISSMAELGVRIKTIEISGNHQLRRDQVLALSNLQADQPLMGFDGTLVRSRLLSEPWIEEAVVERHLPSLVSIKISEWTPIALWRKSTPTNSTEPYAYIDSSGRSLADELSLSPKKLTTESFLRVSGNDANRVADSLRLMVKVEPRLASRITSAEWIGGRRWNVILDGRLLVKLPAEKAANSWSKLSELETHYSICDRRIAVIDFRQSDRIIVTPGRSWTEAHRDPRPVAFKSQSMGRVG